jgi:hypothetical protein
VCEWHQKRVGVQRIDDGVSRMRSGLAAKGFTDVTVKSSPTEIIRIRQWSCGAGSVRSPHAELPSAVTCTQRSGEMTEEAGHHPAMAAKSAGLCGHKGRDCPPRRCPSRWWAIPVSYVSFVGGVAVTLVQQSSLLSSLSEAEVRPDQASHQALSTSKSAIF